MSNSWTSHSKSLDLPLLPFSEQHQVLKLQNPFLNVKYIPNTNCIYISKCTAFTPCTVCENQSKWVEVLNQLCILRSQIPDSEDEDFVNLYANISTYISTQINNVVDNFKKDQIKNHKAISNSK